MSDKAQIAGNQQETTFVNSNLINHKWGILRDYTPNTLNYTDELVTLIALLFTDGGISKHRLSSWRIFFANTSLDAIELFRECITNIFQLPSYRVKIRTTNDRYHFAVVTSKEIGNFLLKSFGTFRTLKFKDDRFPGTSIPVDELVKNRKVELFLRISFSMDGGVKFYRARETNGKYTLRKNVTLACHHPILRQQYSDLLKSIGIDSVNVESDKVVRIQGEINVKEFAKKVRFIEGIRTTRHSRHWFNRKKNEVLRLMIESYDNPSRFINELSVKI